MVVCGLKRGSCTPSLLGLTVYCVVGVLVLGAANGFAAEDEERAEYEKLLREVRQLRKEVATQAPVAAGVPVVDQVVANKYGPNAPVSTRQGKLTIGGLVQIWAYSIQNDNKAWFDVDKWAEEVNAIPPVLAGSNEVADNDSYRVRRAELRFTMDIHENVRAMVMMDLARAPLSFPTFPSNVGTGISGDSVVNYNPGTTPGVSVGHVRNEAARLGLSDTDRLLQDAYIHFHGLVPHHDAKVGQMRRRLGEEGSRDSAALDFTERAMITQLAELRDTGAQIHGTWFDDRLQYWFGMFNGAGTAFQERQNRADDNDEKDLTATILARPVWKDENWGSLELGYSYLHGIAGEAAGDYPLVFPVDGLNRRTTNRVQQYAWGHYAPGGPMKGFWMRGEWGYYRDRFAPNEAYPGLIGNPSHFKIQGWYFAAGYRLQDSVGAESIPSLLRPLEFVFRYEDMQNLFYTDLAEQVPWGLFAHRSKLDVFKTVVYTGGINYYIKGHNAKLQLNYNVVREESDMSRDFRQVREVRNDNLVVNFQVAW